MASLPQDAFTFLPRRHPLHVVVGSPVRFKKIADPSHAEVAVAHQAYIESLVTLFEKHKATFYGKDTSAELEVW